MTSTRVLLTGGSGFIGRHAIAPLLAQDFEIHTTGRRPLAALSSHHIHHIADLMDHRQADRLMQTVSPAGLVHLAWDVTHGKFWTAGENLDWTAASLALYRSFARHGGKRAVFAGSFAEYDWSESHLDEATSKLAPATLYGKAKCALHSLISAAAAQDQISIAWARLFMLYGPGEQQARFVPSIARALAAGAPAFCQNGGLIRDFLHVADAGRAVATLFASGHEGPINIASGTPVALRDVAVTIAGLTGRRDLLTISDGRPAEPPCLTAAVERLRGIGFRPAIALEQGLADVIAGQQEALF